MATMAAKIAKIVPGDLKIVAGDLLLAIVIVDPTPTDLTILLLSNALTPSINRSEGVLRFKNFQEYWACGLFAKMREKPYLVWWLDFSSLLYQCKLVLQKAANKKDTTAQSQLISMHGLAKRIASDCSQATGSLSEANALQCGKMFNILLNGGQ